MMLASAGIKPGCVHVRALDRPSFVITGLVPVIHVYSLSGCKDVDGRVKPGHDEPKET
jgi:hypothetical protein